LSVLLIKYCSGDQIEKSEMGGACSVYGGEERCMQGFGGEVGRPKRRWEDNIKMDLQEVGCGVVDWIVLVQDRDKCWAFANAVMNLRVP
jgi:hypothetical protein